MYTYIYINKYIQYTYLIIQLLLGWFFSSTLCILLDAHQKPNLWRIQNHTPLAPTDATLNGQDGPHVARFNCRPWMPRRASLPCGMQGSPNKQRKMLWLLHTLDHTVSLRFVFWASQWRLKAYWSQRVAAGHNIQECTWRMDMRHGNITIYLYMYIY